MHRLMNKKEWILLHLVHFIASCGAVKSIFCPFNGKKIVCNTEIVRNHANYARSKLAVTPCYTRFCLENIKVARFLAR